MRKSDVSLIIPCYNEEDSIDFLFENLLIFSSKSQMSIAVIFVNDGSTDNTVSLICSRNNLPFECRIVTLLNNVGSHAAVRAGLMHCDSDYSVYFPSDMQISLDEVELMHKSVVSNCCDVVVAVRESNEVRGLVRIFSIFYSRLMRKYVNRQFPVKGIETLLISERVVKLMNSNIERHSSFALQILSYGFKAVFLNISKKDRHFGKSKWTASAKVKLFLDSFIAFSYAPIRLVSMTGILLFTTGVFMTIYLVLRKLMMDDLLVGWPALYSTLLVGFGVTNIGLGIVAEYLWRTLDTVRKRPLFVVDKIINLNNEQSSE